MTTTFAVIAAGAMGAGVGARLTENGAEVITSLAGRSKSTADRAGAARMRAVSDAEIVKADIILSIVPPKDAIALAQGLAPALRDASIKPLYIDCNAISPDTAKRVASIVLETGAAFADGGIIGGPPRAGYDGPTLYVSGVATSRVATLASNGLVVEVIDGSIGAASALKMSYAAITKGLTALASASILAATQAGAAGALHRELASSQPALLSWIARSVPDMFPKAYRFVGEMQEIASFTTSDASRDIYEGIAALYQQLADDAEGDRSEIQALAEFFAQKGRERS